MKEMVHILREHDKDWKQPGRGETIAREEDDNETVFGLQVALPRKECDSCGCFHPAGRECFWQRGDNMQVVSEKGQYHPNHSQFSYRCKGTFDSICNMFYEISFQWIVVKEPLKIGKKQIEAFRSLKDRSGQNLGEK